MSEISPEHLRLETYVVAGLQSQFDTLVVFLLPEDASLVDYNTGVLLS